ncbi:hypothetical protein DFH08DRAFT_813081 [Mycena albidolilacea]|uniref:Uncharacterized protein n=1 Tax=Mycena albidolilacea TaxID=1033008 RepID=A0AAD6ZSC2_9AGAR|nr:hypothetical protein DFH08DRAFT_813081 [Mycena albidolilacea]
MVGTGLGDESPSEYLQWPMFVTAVAPNAKALNRAFLLIQGFEKSEHLSDSKWTVFSSRNLPSTTLPPTSSPFSPRSRNDFAGLSQEGINAFMNQHWTQLDEMSFTFELWMILDQTGLDTDTCVICKHPYNGDDEPATWGYSDEFEALRVPLDQACAVYASLYTGREFEDYRGVGKWPDGSYQFARNAAKMKDSEALEREEKVWESWRNQGFVD